MNSYTFYPGDYLRDTQHLSMLEHGAYRLLLDFYYSTERPLPANAKQLQSIAHAKTPHEKRALVFVLGHFFELGEDGFYHSAKADKELAKYADIKEKRKDAAMQMHSKRHANAPALALSPIPYPLPLKDKEENKERKPASPKGSVLSPYQEKIKEVCDIFTRITGKKVDPEAKYVISAVKPRLQEGYSPDDYQSIIAYKNMKWGADEKMRDSLNLTTLSRPINFSRYLDEAKEATPAPVSAPVQPPVRTGPTVDEMIAKKRAETAERMAALAVKKF